MNETISPPAGYLDLCHEGGIATDTARECWKHALASLLPQAMDAEQIGSADMVAQDWQIAPNQPTEVMFDAGYDATRLADGTPQFAKAGFCLGHAGVIYRAMLAAAPKYSHSLSALASTGLSAAFLRGANITGPVRVQNMEQHVGGREYGRSTWSEVLVNRKGNPQVAHCADQEDADLIAHLINAAVAAAGRHGTTDQIPFRVVTFIAKNIQVTADDEVTACRYALDDAKEFRKNWTIHTSSVEAAGANAAASDTVGVEVRQTQVEDEIWTFDGIFTATVVAATDDDARREMRRLMDT